MTAVPMRVNWRLAEANERWSSLRSSWSAHCGPSRWGQTVRSVLFLKDTSGSFYKNELLAGGNRFRYELPSRPKDFEAPVVDLLLRYSAKDEEADGVGPKTTHVPLEVRLFVVRNARDHYLGEWTPVRFEPASDGRRSHVILARLEEQREDLRQQTVLTRSASEKRHEVFLRRAMGGWTVEHEPESATRLDMPLVAKGRMAAWSSDEYTVDFICCRGFNRICFESKADFESVNETCRLKCRSLRDGSLCRVMAIYGHGSSLRVVDFGTKGEQTYREYDEEAFERLIRRLRTAEEAAMMDDDDPGTSH